MTTLLRDTEKENTAVGIAIAIALCNLDKLSKDVIYKAITSINNETIIDVALITDVVERVKNNKELSFTTKSEHGLVLHEDFITEVMKDAMRDEKELINSARLYVSRILIKG